MPMRRLASSADGWEPNALSGTLMSADATLAAREDVGGVETPTWTLIDPADPSTDAPSALAASNRPEPVGVELWCETASGPWDGWRAKRACWCPLASPVTWFVARVTLSARDERTGPAVRSNVVSSDPLRGIVRPVEGCSERERPHRRADLALPGAADGPIGEARADISAATDVDAVRAEPLCESSPAYDASMNTDVDWPPTVV